MRTPASENTDVIAILTKDELWDLLRETEQARDNLKRIYIRN